MKILAVNTQRIGDVLLMTPLIKSLKHAYPDAAIDCLVCKDTMQAIEGNPDIHNIIAIERRSTKSHRLGELFKLWNAYDISVTTIPSDRARIYAWAAAKKHYGMHLDNESLVFRKLMYKSVLFDNTNTHTVSMNLSICELMGIKKHFEMVLPVSDLQSTKNKPIAVIHPYPKFAYKSWTKQGWLELLEYLSHKGFHILISGGSDADEINYCQSLASSDNIENIAGKYSLAEMSTIIRQADIYIGVDTSVTHLAAATGVKVFAIYGPTNPVKWGPWPIHANASVIWLRQSTSPQTHSNVTLIQGAQSCVPCAEEGCDRHIHSLSECLTTLKSETIIQAIKSHLTA